MATKTKPVIKSVKPDLVYKNVDERCIIHFADISAKIKLGEDDLKKFIIEWYMLIEEAAGRYEKKTDNSQKNDVSIKLNSQMLPANWNNSDSLDILCGQLEWDKPHAECFLMQWSSFLKEENNAYYELFGFFDYKTMTVWFWEEEKFTEPVWDEDDLSGDMEWQESEDDLANMSEAEIKQRFSSFKKVIETIDRDRRQKTVPSSDTPERFAS